MRVSRNEVYRIAQRALEASGAPFGVDRDGASAVAWLEARQLPGLELLAMTLRRMEGAFDPLPSPDFAARPPVLDLAGRPGIAWAGAIVDCLDLVAARQPAEPAQLVVRRCRWPLLLLPALADRAARGTGLRLQWRYAEATMTCIADPDGRCRIVLEGSPIDIGQVVRSSGPVELRIGARSSTVRAAPRVRRSQVIDAETLDAAVRRTLTTGIQVEDALWAELADVAGRVLVPASEESRRGGAGGGDTSD